MNMVLFAGTILHHIQLRLFSTSISVQTHCKKMNMVLFAGTILHHIQLRLFSTSISVQTHCNANVRHAQTHHLTALCNEGRLKEALHILDITENHAPNSHIYVCLLQGCIKRKALPEAKLVHAHINQTGFMAGTVLGNTLVNVYVKCGNVVDARRVFDQMPERNVCSWTVMIAGYARHGVYPAEALALFHQMEKTGVQPNQFTFASVLPACANLASLAQGMEIHQHIIRCGYESNVFVMSALVDMYAKCGFIEKAREVFDKMHQRDIVSWTAMAAGYARNGLVDESLKLFNEMPQRNMVSWNSMIAGFADNGFVDQALKLFNEMPQRDGVSWNAIVTGFARKGYVDEALKLFQKMPQISVVACNAMIAGFLQNGLVDEASKLFKEMPQRDIASWNSMISGFGQNGLVDEARKLFMEMPQRDVVSWNVMITSFAQNGLTCEALRLFNKMPERDVVSWNAMIAGFTHTGYIDQALKLFNEMPQRDVVSWNTMIAGFVQNGHCEEALHIFQQMQLAGVKANSKTFTTILPACADLAALELGMVIYEKIIGSGYQFDVLLVNALIDMFAKCGSINMAREVFDKMHKRDAVSWTTMIAGYAMHGYGKEALTLFEEMKQSGMSPDRVTFLNVLFACSHTGLVDEGYKYFNSMSALYHLIPSMEHYRCMVDLLARAGHLQEAQDFINKMPIKADAIVWICLLGACRVYNNVELGESVAERIFETDPRNVAPYVLLSNIYAAVGRWGDIEKLQKLMKKRSVKRATGCSWLEVNKKMHAFLVGDS